MIYVFFTGKEKNYPLTGGKRDFFPDKSGRGK